MPVISRGVVQLTPDTTLGTSTRNYLNNLPPSLATLQTGLALFAVVIIARFCAVRLYLWLQQVRGAERHILPTTRSQIVSAPYPQLLPSRPIWTMDEKDITPPATQEDRVVGEGPGQEVKSSTGKKLVINPTWQNPVSSGSGGNAMPMQLMSRPPPAPPLTPPELSTAVFTFDDRPRPGEDSFIHQPNPDYMSSTTSAILPPRSASPSIARRRSYNKTLPIGVPASQGTSDAADLTFSPSSYPPTSPLLPPAPPNAGAKGIDVQGEIIGVLDAEGAGWTRHTRVYGGGVCLACAASGGNHGGGFYGATVRPEEMR
ncbi:hypothetical protein ACHAPT_001530 [Fusarium lateritium]